MTKIYKIVDHAAGQVASQLQPFANVDWRVEVRVFDNRTDDLIDYSMRIIFAHHAFERFQITERRNADHASPTDPKAGAMHKHSGVFDLRDMKPGKIDSTIIATSRDLKALRKTQARLNSAQLGSI